MSLHNPRNKIKIKIKHTMTARWSETLMEISKDLLDKKERKLIIDTLEGFGNKSQQCAYSSLQGLVD